MTSKETIKKFIDANLNVIGISNDKTPAEGSWKRWQSEMRTAQDLKGDGVGIICGSISGNTETNGLEVIDIDTKYDITNTLYDRFKEKINEQDGKLLNKLMIIQTKSGGYHWLYRCDVIEKSLKLAMRPPTEDEREDSDLVLIETRGEASYICTWPTKGYKLIQHSFREIPTITPEEREIIFSSAREFNEIIEPIKVPTSVLKNSFNITKSNEGLTPWEDFDKNGMSIPEILLQAGWTFVSEDSQREYYKRPGQSTSKHSGNYLKASGCFKSFSSSTELEPGKAYYPYALYTMLIHNGDWKQSARQVFKDGYGDKTQGKGETNQEYGESRYSKVSDIDTFSDVDIAKYISNYEDDFAYLNSVRDDNVAMGLSTGSKIMDEYFLFKPSTFNIHIGHTSVGKTFSVIFLTLLAALKHKWKIIIMGMENNAGTLKRQIIELYLQKPLNKTTSEEFQRGNKFIDDHYTFIMARGGHIRTISDALKLCYKMLDKEHYDMVFLDPYSGFQTDRIGGETSHEANYRLCGDMLNFTTKTKVNLMLSLHTVTSARREIDEATGNLRAPRISDVEGGALFSNRADSCICWHRLIDHEDKLERMTTQMLVAKDRNLESGGSLNSRNNPIRLQLRDWRFYIDGYEDVVYNIKNAGKVKDPIENVVEIKYDEDIPF